MFDKSILAILFIDYTALILQFTKKKLQLKEDNLHKIPAEGWGRGRLTYVFQINVFNTFSF